jgi:hypothetical protein
MLYEGDGSGAVTVRSRLNAWMLTHWYGYRLKNTYRGPAGGLFGQVRYAMRWNLEPKARGPHFGRSGRRCA